MSEIKDKALKSNENIEKFAEILQHEPSIEGLAAALSAVRRSMVAGGQFIVPVQAPDGESMKIRVLEDGGKKWFPVYTSFDEEMAGGEKLISTFMTDIDQILNVALTTEDIEGVIINPWRRTLKLDKHYISIILGNIQ